MKKLFFLLLLLSTGSFANNENDSLLQVLKTTKADTQKVNILYSLCLNQDKPEIAEMYARQLLELSQKIVYPKGISWGHNLLGSIYKSKGDFRASLKEHEKALEVLLVMNDSLSIAKVHNNIGEAYRLLGEPTKALSHYFTSLSTLEKLNKQKLIAISLSNIAIIYRQQKNPEKSLEYNLRSLEIRRKIKDEAGMASSLDNIGIIYYSQKKYKEALANASQAVEIRERVKDTSGLASSYNNISNIYSESGQPEMGLKYQMKSLAMREYMNDKRGIAMSYNNLGNIYLLLNDRKKALDNQERSLAMAKALGNRELLSNSYESLMKLYRATGNFEKALMYQDLFSNMKDSLLNSENTRQIAEMQTKYETEKKDLELNSKSLELENTRLEVAKSRSQRNILILSIAVFLVLTYLLFSRHRLHQKQRWQAEQLRQSELRSKAIIEAEEKERIRIAQELHDGVGQQLSAVKMNMSTLESQLQLSGKEQQQLMSQVIEMVDESVKEVRAVSHNMMPNALLKAGLGAAAREFLNRINGSKLKIELEISGLEERLDNTVEMILFRVLQEIVNNIIKHADASNVNIQIIHHGNEVTMMVEDNGKGFDTKHFDAGLGLRNIQSRIEYLNGTVHFDSYPGKGTTVSVEVPVK
jgi:signal transduction histidine kinase